MLSTCGRSISTPPLTSVTRMETLPRSSGIVTVASYRPVSVYCTGSVVTEMPWLSTAYVWNWAPLRTSGKPSISRAWMAKTKGWRMMAVRAPGTSRVHFSATGSELMRAPTGICSVRTTPWVGKGEPGSQLKPAGTRWTSKVPEYSVSCSAIKEELIWGAVGNGLCVKRRGQGVESRHVSGGGDADNVCAHGRHLYQALPSIRARNQYQSQLSGSGGVPGSRRRRQQTTRRWC